MLSTPFGSIYMRFDGLSIPFNPIDIPSEAPFSDVDGCCYFSFYYAADGKQHTLECGVDGIFKETFPETGERQECISLYAENGKMSLACEASFGDYKDYGYDFDGYLESKSISIEIFPETKSQTFHFAVSWLMFCTKENDHQTWFGADPWLLRKMVGDRYSHGKPVS